MATLAAGLGAACSQERSPAAPTCVTWQGDVAPLLDPCTTCHGGARPEANYDLRTYLGALGGGRDEVPDVIAGEPSSRLLTQLEPARADEVHQVPSSTLATLRRWIVDCDVAALETPLHARGVLDPSSAQFHGVTVAGLGWDLGACARCHGERFDGGTAASSCETCHAGGPTACETCHALDPQRAPRGTQGGQRPYGVGALDGAHARHAAVGLDCAACHQVPEAWDSEGHVRRAGGGDPAPAEVSFGDAARRGGASPSYAERRCTGVYCHGETLLDGGAAITRPSWDGGAAHGACGSCHGAPPATHADDRCDVCHPPSAAVHLDGVTTIGAGSGCSGCHGDASSPAPPRDLSGATATTAPGVGAHRAHLDGPQRLRGPVPCRECHRVPATIDAPGHIDSPAPAEVTAALGWDRGSGTCQTAWCHGPGRPHWTVRGEVGCGACHGIPPLSAPHTPGMPLSSCATCHPRSVDALGNILFVSGPDGPTSEHINGLVDLP